MYLWTVQHKKVIEILIKTGTYFPSIHKANGYSEMKLIYPSLLESFNHLNNSSYAGMIFGFYKINGLGSFENVNALYDYLYKHPEVSSAFNFWNSNSVILQVKIDKNISIMPMEFNDIIKLSIGKTKDISMINCLYESVEDFNRDILNIITYMNHGYVNPFSLHTSFIEGHYPYLTTQNIIGVYPNWDQKASLKNNAVIIFDLFDDAKSLKEIIHCQK